MTVTETDVSLKDRREARSVSGVHLLAASQQGQPTSVVADEHFVWTLIRLLVSRDDGDATAPTWNEFLEIYQATKHPNLAQSQGMVLSSGPLLLILVQYCRTDTTREWLDTTRTTRTIRTGRETMVYKSYRSWNNCGLHIISKTAPQPPQYDPHDPYGSYRS